MQAHYEFVRKCTAGRRLLKSSMCMHSLDNTKAQLEQRCAMQPRLAEAQWSADHRVPRRSKLVVLLTYSEPKLHLLVACYGLKYVLCMSDTELMLP